MNENMRIACLACISATLLIGCGRKNESVDMSDANHRAQETIQSTADLRRLLLPSLDTKEIVRDLGEPRWKEELGKGCEVWHYNLAAFPADDAMQGSYVVGVAIGITNGRLANWGCSYVGSSNAGFSGKQTVLAGNVQADSPIVELFVVREDLIDGGRFIDTERFPKLGYISQKADADFTKLREVTVDESKRLQPNGSQSVVWSFGITLMPDDKKRLNSLTETNISKRLLIMVGNRPITAPMIRGPLETGSFRIDCDDGALAEFLKKQLAQMQ